VATQYFESCCQQQITGLSKTLTADVFHLKETTGEIRNIILNALEIRNIILNAFTTVDVFHLKYNFKCIYLKAID